MRLDIYKIAHSLKDTFPFIWTVVEKINEYLFVLRYGKKLRKIEEGHDCGDFSFRRLRKNDCEDLVRFFSDQPAEAFKFFNPHKFDKKSVDKILKNRSYLAFGVFDGSNIIGYCFLRSFFMGKSYFGKIVDYRYRGKGVAKCMSVKAVNTAVKLGIHMYGSISKDNESSFYSAKSALDIKVIKELPNNYLLVEELPKGSIK